MTNWLLIASGCPVSPFVMHVEIDVGRGGDDGEAHEIFPATSGAAGDLLHFADRQVRKVTRLCGCWIE